MAWEDVTISLMHYYPLSQGARVTVTSTRAGTNHHIVSSASHEGMTVDDPNITLFLAWARTYYEGATFREIHKDGADTNNR